MAQKLLTSPLNDGFFLALSPQDRASIVNFGKVELLTLCDGHGEVDLNSPEFTRCQVDHGVPSHDPPSNGCFGTGDPLIADFEEKAPNCDSAGNVGLPNIDFFHGSLREVGHDVAEVCCEAEPFFLGQIRGQFAKKNRS